MNARFPLLLALLLALCAPPCLAETPPETLTLRGAWVWGTSCKDRPSADAMLRRAELMNLNALYVLVFYWGATACYQSAYVPTNASVEPGFDPLAYLVEEGRDRGIDIHAWFVNGRNTRGSEVFKQHPTWMAMDLMGQRVEWFDLCRPDVRNWQTKVMLEVLQNYDVAGLHFDYIRFNGKDISVDPTVVARAEQEAGVDIGTLTYPELPAYGHFRGNPLAEPTTAQVLAYFGDQTPAIATNALGAGEVILFNWHADMNTPRAIHDAMRRALARLGAKSRVLLLDSDINAVKYTHRFYQDARAWLIALGFTPTKIRDDDILTLSGSTPVVLPKHYLMTDAQAQALVTFVRNGGGALFIDGPVYAMRNSAAAQQLLGFKRSGRYFNEERLLLPMDREDSFVPHRSKMISIAGERDKHQTWDQWRKDQITKLVDQVSRASRRAKPDRAVTAAVFRSEVAANGVLQDWPRWLREGLLHYAIPMCYVETPEQLEEAFAWWKTLDTDMRQIVPGISLYKTANGRPRADHAEQIRLQVEVCRAQGARGVVMFSLRHITDDAAALVGERVFNRPETAETGAE
ncbi:MAG: family 10 glycosylhydrolase, partial [Candidatus Latescibacteria bacterium]|nr:family 10 glycosylhydrolase [Candidatus Latescibacterota bacterium]